MGDSTANLPTAPYPSGKKTVFRLLLAFLPQAHLVITGLLLTLVYASALAIRPALVYLVLRVLTEGVDPAELESQVGDVPLAPEIIRPITGGDHENSAFLKDVNGYLDKVDDNVGEFLAPLLSDEITSDPVKMASVSSFGTIIVFYLLLTILLAITHMAEHTVKQYAIIKILISLRVKLLENLLFQPLKFHNDKERGELITRMSADIGCALTSMNILIMDITRQGWQVIVPILIVAKINAWLLGIVFIFAGFFFFQLRKQTVRVRSRARVRQERTSKVTEAMVQLFSGIRVVKAFGLENEKVAHYKERNREFAHDAMSTEVAKAWTRTLMEFLTNFVVLITITIGASLFLFGDGGGGLSVGMMVLVVVMMGQMYRPIRLFTRAYTNLGDNLAGAQRMFEFMDLKPEMRDRSDAIVLTDVVGGVRFEDVSFAYSGGDKVLEHINLEIPAGQIVALVGPSGAGKSTLANLVPRFYDADSGSITIDGTDIREFTQDSLRRHIAIVTQDPFLFNTTIRENIGHGRPGATEEQIIEAAKAANIHDHIMTLDDGYDSIAGERGVKLSGGQCQRITIARAILRDARILILDEATSSLDTESERAVQKALHNLMEGRTTLVIAHRLSTVQHADKICVLEDGSIVDVGTHDELMARDTLYRRLYEMQFTRVGT